MDRAAPKGDVARKFADIAEPARSRLLSARQMIFDVAQGQDKIGPLTETLKWGQPSYLTELTKSGTTIRLGVTKADVPTLFVHCQTTIIPEVQAQFSGELSFEDGRGVHLTDDTPDALLQIIIQRALTYHAGKS